jgi:ribosome-binding factor A
MRTQAMADTARARKLADRIHEIVAEALEKRVKDPRLGFVTVTDTRVTGDLQHATIFYTVFGDTEEQVATAAALESAKGILRSEVGRRTGIRLTPTLTFIADAIPENAAHIEDLLRTAAARDADVAALAAAASYAGEPDPYRHDPETDPDGADPDAAPDGSTPDGSTPDGSAPGGADANGADANGADANGAGPAGAGAAAAAADGEPVDVGADGRRDA